MAQTPANIDPQTFVSAVDHIIQARMTKKVFRDPADPAEITAAFMPLVNEAIKVSSWAPFHYPAHKSHRETGKNSVVPWRYYAYDAAACRQLIDTISTLSIEHGGESNIWRDAPKSKVPRMLAAAGAMVQVTWLPDPPHADPTPTREAERQKRNEEHLMAASAAVQNLMLAAEARGLESYWASGGCLRTPEAFQAMGIPLAEKIVGSIYLFPAVTEESNYVTGKLRDSRGEPADWVTWK